MILDELFQSVQSDAPITTVLMGIYWTVVATPNGAGMAATFGNCKVHGEEKIRGVGTFEGMSARTLAEFAYSENHLEASLGIAALNALLCPAGPVGVELNAFHVLADWGREKRVAMVGHFPFAEKLRARVGELMILEINPDEGDYPAEMAGQIIPTASVVAITGSTLINHTLDNLLKLCNPNARVIIMGPSTPLSPVLLAHGVDIISGVQILNLASVIRTIGQGATFQQVEGVRLVTLDAEHHITGKA